MEYLKTHFSKEDIQMVKRHMKRCSILLVVRGKQGKTTMRYQLTAIRIAIIKKLQTANTEEGVEKRKLSYTVDGNVNWYCHYREQHGDSFKN